MSTPTGADERLGRAGGETQVLLPGTRKAADLPRRAGAQHIRSVPPEMITPFIASFLTCEGVPGNIFTLLNELAANASLFALPGLTGLTLGLTSSLLRTSLGSPAWRSC